jgi:hypothetical protein
MAFRATYDFGFLETRLEANLSLGLLVIANLNTFRDDSGRSNYFSREFFYKSDASQEQPSQAGIRTDSVRAMRAEDQPELEGPVPPGSIDPTPFLGDWLSTNSNTRGIARLVITGDDDGLIAFWRMRLHSATGVRPAAASCRRCYVKAGLAFSASYDFGFKETFAGKVKKGVLVVATSIGSKTAAPDRTTSRDFYRARAKGGFVKRSRFPVESLLLVCRFLT